MDRAFGQGTCGERSIAKNPMPFKLKVVSAEGQESESNQERVYYVPEVRVGSAAGNELVLRDVQRTVSRQHARIYQDGDQYLLEDTKSRNGTQINGQVIAPSQPVRLKDGDRIAVGPFNLVFASVAAEHERTASAAGEVSTMALVNVTQLAEELIVQLRSDYAEHSASTAEQRRQVLENTVRQALVRPDLDEPAKQEMLQLVRRAFPDRSHELARLRRQAEQWASEHATFAVTGKALRAAYDGFSSLQGRLSGTDPGASQATDFTPLAKQIGGTVEVFLGAALQLLNGYKEWQRELNLGKLGQTHPAPAIATATTKESLGHYLYDMHSGDSPAERVERLREALQIVVFHQIAVLAGYEASIRSGMQWMLQEFAPENFKTGTRRLFGGADAQWDRYVQRHQSMMQEDSMQIQKRFLSGFKRGYEDKLDELVNLKP